MACRSCQIHHRSEHGSEPARGDNVSIGGEHEVVQPGEEGPMLEGLLDERVHALLERQTNPNSDAPHPHPNTVTR